MEVFKIEGADYIDLDIEDFLYFSNYFTEPNTPESYLERVLYLIHCTNHFVESIENKNGVFVIGLEPGAEFTDDELKHIKNYGFDLIGSFANIYRFSCRRTDFEYNIRTEWPELGDYM